MCVYRQLQSSAVRKKKGGGGGGGSDGQSGLSGIATYVQSPCVSVLLSWDSVHYMIIKCSIELHLFQKSSCVSLLTVILCIHCSIAQYLFRGHTAF